MKKISRILLVALVLLGANAFLIPSMVLGADVGTGPTGTGADVGTGDSSGTGGGLTNPLGSIDSLPEFMNAILAAIVTLGTIVLTFAIIYVGFLFVKAQGNAEQISAARSALLWTVIGGLILLGAQTVGMVLQSTVESLK